MLFYSKQFWLFFTVFLKGKIIGYTLEEFSSLSATLWYCFGTLIGESITRDKRLEVIKALRYDQLQIKVSRTNLTLTNILFRWCLGAWILYCFIIGASYSGSVRAFLILPMSNEPIKNLIDILNSGFAVGYTYTGEEASILLSHQFSEFNRF